jgi:hypothetical protein
MKLNLLFSMALACGLMGASANAQTAPPATGAPATAPAPTPTDTQSKADKCKDYATQAAQNSSSSTGAMRGAARAQAIDNNNGVGGVGSYGNGNNAAAKGALVGGARRRAQKNDAYQTNYDQCMAQP